MIPHWITVAGKTGSPQSGSEVQTDAASLTRMHDIVVPDPAPWWPPAPGWYLLLTLLGVALGWWLVRNVRSAWNNRYRKAALRELEVLRRASPGQHRDRTLAQLNRILKRTALASHPRSVVAGLSGQSWIRFLEETSRGTFSADEREFMLDLVWSRERGNRLSEDQMQNLFLASERWIRNHAASALGSREQAA